MPMLSKFDRKSILISSASFIIGLGIGMFLEQCLAWNRQVGRFNELIRRLAIIEDEIRILRVNLRGSQTVRTDVDGLVTSNLKTSRQQFEDDDSENDDFMSVTSDLSGAVLNNNFFNEMDALLNGSFDEKKRAYHTLREKRIKFSDNDDFLWRLARACYFMYEKEGGAQNEQAKQYIYEAFFFVEKALNVNPNSAPSHKWYAIIIGVIGECEGTESKIKKGYEFQEHITRALQLDPHDSEAHHLKGRFCYAVYMLSWLERQVASALFATPPSARIEDALTCFQQCEDLAPNQLKRNQLYLARCLIAMGDTAGAVTWLEKAAALTPSDEYDATFQPDIETLLSQYRR